MRPACVREGRRGSKEKCSWKVRRSVPDVFFYLAIPAETVFPVVSRGVEVDNRCSITKTTIPMRMMRTGFICLLLECEGDYF